MAKFKKGDRFQLKPGIVYHGYKDWKTIVIVGEPYQSDRVYYPVHVNGEKYTVLPESNIVGNFDRHVDFTPGFYQYTNFAGVPDGPVVFFKEKPPVSNDFGYWKRITVVDWNSATHE